MDIHSYQSYEEPRTASRHNTAIKSIQGWKNRKGTVQKGIISSLNEVAEGRSAGFNKSLNKAMSYAPQQTQPTSTSKQEAFQFGDVIDVINPLQHIPVVGVVYRNLTGDELHPLSNIIGGALYGGPVGAVTGTMNAVSKIRTGKDFGEHAIDLIKPDNTKPKTITMAKQNITPPPHNMTQVDDITTLKLAAMPPRQLY